MVETQMQLLHRAAERLGINYTELAKALGVSRQAISQYRHGYPMSTEVAVRLAKLTGDTPEYVIACTSHNSDARKLEDPELDDDKRAGIAGNLKIWERMAKEYRRAP